MQWCLLEWIKISSRIQNDTGSLLMDNAAAVQSIMWNIVPELVCWRPIFLLKRRMMWLILVCRWNQLSLFCIMHNRRRVHSIHIHMHPIICHLVSRRLVNIDCSFKWNSYLVVQPTSPNITKNDRSVGRSGREVTNRRPTDIEVRRPHRLLSHAYQKRWKYSVGRRYQTHAHIQTKLPQIGYKKKLEIL